VRWSVGLTFVSSLTKSERPLGITRASNQRFFPRSSKEHEGCLSRQALRGHVTTMILFFSGQSTKLSTLWIRWVGFQ
jgi:hypothetical protein